MLLEYEYWGSKYWKSNFRI